MVDGVIRPKLQICYIPPCHTSAVPLVVVAEAFGAVSAVFTVSEKCASNA